VGKERSTFHFRLISLSIAIRDFFSPRKNILKEVDIKPGTLVLDFGCGPGSYIEPATKLVGKSGKVIALDANQLALKSVKNLIIKRHLTNVEMIHSDCKTALHDNTVDVILLYDVFHGLKHPHEVLKELHRVLKNHGLLSVSDDHLEENELLTGLAASGYFKLAAKGKKTFTFSKI
jgi:ubiquinone/menaquinone biosynthesis C-methylase UbiE